MVRNETTEWTYNWELGALCGSPDAVIGNLRDIVADRERRNEGIVENCTAMSKR